MRTKTLFAAALVGLGSMANAQTTQMSNDDGVVITPEAGDWAIGFNAAPLLNYAGNMFNGTSGNSMSTAFVNGNQAIYGKYFTDENTAYRGSLRLATGSSTINSLYAGANGDSLTNTAKFSGGAVVLGAGLEKRKGHNRLQGYYGGEVMITLGGSSAKEAYTYAAAMDTVSLNAGILVDENGAASTARTDSKSYGTTFGVGVRGFIGAEYFFAPKMSIAAEYGWGLNYSSTSGSETTVSSLSVADNVVTETVVAGGKNSSFGIDTDNLGGAIRLMFHF